MTRLSEPLQALVRAERNAVGPDPDAAAACWARIAADLERGALPDLDVPPPATHRGLVHLALVVLGVGAVAVGLYSWRVRDEAPTPASTPSRVDPPAPIPARSEPPARVETPAPIPARNEPPARVETPAPILNRSEPPAPDPTQPPDDPAALVADEPPAPAPPRPRRSRSPEPVLEDTFAAELKLIAEGHAALNGGDPGAALRIADTYKRTYPRGPFVEDRDALRTLALCAAGDGAAAARRFLAAHPRSIHAPRVREACNLPAAGK